MTPIVISESTTEPITLAEAVLNVKAFSSDPEIEAGSRLSQIITAARQACEEELEVSLVQKTLEVSQDCFGPPYIELPLGPVRSITSVKYKDADGIDQPLPADQYRISSYTGVKRLLPAWNVTWPTIRGDLDSVRVRYTVGYPSTDSPVQEVPHAVRQAMHLLIAHYFDMRHALDESRLVELPLGVRYLLGKYRRGLGV